MYWANINFYHKGWTSATPRCGVGWLLLVITTGTLKFVYIIFNFYHTLVSERNLMFYIKFSFQVYSFIIFGHLIPFEL